MRNPIIKSKIKKIIRSREKEFSQMSMGSRDGGRRDRRQGKGKKKDLICVMFMCPLQAKNVKSRY